MSGAVDDPSSHTPSERTEIQPACELCELTERLEAADELVPVGTHWTANVRQLAGRPAIVLQVRRHRAGLEALLPAEAAEMGTAIQTVAAALERAPAVERVYAQSFNEAAGQHVHVHVAPRFRGERELGPNAATDVVPPPEFDITAVLAELAGPTESVPPSAKPEGLRRAVRTTKVRRDLLMAAAGAVAAAVTLRACLDQAVTDLENAGKAVDGARGIEVGQAATEVRQARDLTERFRRLYAELPGSVARLMRDAASVEIAIRRLRRFHDDFARVFDHQGAITGHLDRAGTYVTEVFDKGAQPEATPWRDLRESGPQHLITARTSLRDLSDRSVEVLEALGYDADLVEVGGA